MSFTREVTIWCDGVRGGERCWEWEQSSGRASPFRRELREKGWRNRGGKDWCPLCAPTGSQQEGESPKEK